MSGVYKRLGHYWIRYRVGGREYRRSAASMLQLPEGRPMTQKLAERALLIAQGLRRSPAGPTSNQHCAICADPTRRVGWDHDHLTGRHRGWLCNNCNAALGLLRDSPALLTRAAAYLTARGRTTSSAGTTQPDNRVGELGT